jgi:glycosyltransferase involved in cell wall biosynthesis
LSGPDLSLVIPAYNEARYLPRLLDSVEAARRRFDAHGRVEVIVADNNSTDATAAVATARGCQVCSVVPRNIAAVRNAGARAATGTIVAWVDADHRIHPDTFVVIAELMRKPDVIGGSSGAWLERWSIPIALTYAMLVPFVWLTGFDTGVVFCRRTDFETIGGYDDRHRFAEDVLFLVALRRLGKQRRQRLVRARGIKVIASTRKFDEFGDWHYFGLLARAPALLFGARFDALADRYWYNPKR